MNNEVIAYGISSKKTGLVVLICYKLEDAKTTLECYGDYFEIVKIKMIKEEGEK